MAVFLDAQTRIVIQGITGSTGRAFAERMLADGTPLVAGVTPGKGGSEVCGRPVYDSVFDAVRTTGATASLIVVPPAAVEAAFLEAAAAGVRLVSVYTEHVPVSDTMRMLAVARHYGTRLCGPNSAGLVSPGQANMSDLSNLPMHAGHIGIVSKSGTLTYEVIDGLDRCGLGESTVVCLGGDPLVGTRYAEVLRAFAADPQTETVVLIGEIGGVAEVEAAEVWYATGSNRKPLVAYIAGQSAPAGKQMGHAGAIITRGSETATAKMQRLRDCGVFVASLVTDVAATVEQALRARSMK